MRQRIGVNSNALGEVYRQGEVGWGGVRETINLATNLLQLRVTALKSLLREM